MKHTYLIDRNNHDTFFIDMSSLTSYNAKKEREYIKKELYGLYPDFTDTIIWDYTLCTINNKKWALTTVIEKNYYIELRIAHPHKDFITPTSVLVCHESFTKGVHFYTDTEQIYFDTKPFSVPKKHGTPKDAIFVSEKDLYAQRKKKYVFNKNTWTKDGLQKKRAFLPILLGVFIVLFVVCVFLLYGKTTHKPIEEKPIIEKTLSIVEVPCALLQVNDIAKIVLENAAMLHSYTFDIQRVPAISFEVMAEKPFDVLDAISNFNYIASTDIEALQHTNNDSLCSASLYLQAMHAPQVSANTENIFIILEELKNIPLIQNDTLVLQNTGDNSGIQLQGAYKKEELESIFTELMSIQKEHNVFMSKLVLLRSEDGNMLTINCTLMPVSETIVFNDMALEYIVDAFNLKTIEKPKEVKKAPRVDPLENHEKIGRVVNDDGSIINYYRSPEGKIIRVEE